MARKGERLSEEARKNMSEAHKGKHPSEETRRKMGKSRIGIPLSEETRRRISDAQKKRFESEEVRKNFAESRMTLNGEQIAHLAKDYMREEYTSNEELGRKYNITRGIVSYYLRKAVKMGLCTEEEYEAATQRRHVGNTGKRFTEEHRKKIAEGRKGKIHSAETRKRMSDLLKGTRTGTENGFFGRRHSAESLEKMALASLKREKNKSKRYSVENRFETSSLSEGAAAIALERYIPIYRIETGKTFQNEGDTLCLYDFVLEDAILEWHPIDLHHDGGKLLADEYAAYIWNKERINTSDRRAFSDLTREFKETLAKEYLSKRQDASDKSQVFKGRKVHLARNILELYDFISRYNKNMPEYNQFEREFKGLCGYVNQFDTKKQESKLEQKVEVAAGAAGA